MTKDPCLNCGSEKWVSWRKYQDGTEICSDCSKITTSYPKDASGQKVSLPTGFSKAFSYATGTPIESARQYADVLKRKNLSIRDKYTAKEIENQ